MVRAQRQCSLIKPPGEQVLGTRAATQVLGLIHPAREGWRLAVGRE